MRRVVVTGLGVVSPLGDTPADLFARLMAAESGIRPILIDGPRGQYSNIAATVTFDSSRYFPPQKIANLDRATQFALVAAAAAVTDASIKLTDQDKLRAGVCLGTGMGPANTLEENYIQLLDRDPNRLKPLTVLTAMNNAPAAHVAIHNGFCGPNLTFSCACSSSTVAIGEAYRHIRHGYADVMIAGGAEALLTFGVFKAWDAMRILAIADKDQPSASCRPFSKNRSGLVLGEGAAMMILEDRERAVRRNARIYGEVVGYGSSNDPLHIAKPSVEGQARAMTLALADADMSPGDVDYVNAHGTGTLLNDVTETRAIKRVFGDAAYKLPVSSTKSLHGHLLGASGAMEFAIVLLSMLHGEIPPTAHLDVPDPECDLDYVPNHGRRAQDIRCVMSNSFAFGGTNAVLIARQATP
ncbi:MAG: beta-ketoacyl-[acyl-carrier-protein] synthase family protein [Sulfuricaulis sp.]